MLVPRFREEKTLKLARLGSLVGWGERAQGAFHVFREQITVRLQYIAKYPKHNNTP